MGYCTYVHKTDENKARELSAKVKEIWDRKMVLSDAYLDSTTDLEAELAEITKAYKAKIAAAREAFMKEHEAEAKQLDAEYSEAWKEDLRHRMESPKIWH